MQKDRYTKAFLFFAVMAAIALSSEKKHSAFAWIASVAPFIYLGFKPARLHFSEREIKAQYKGENDCGFAEKFIHEVDGIKINGTRYKFSNGTDICIKAGDPVPCGIGSEFVQFMRRAGKEPKSIQNDTCWI